ncbi:DUF3592 domain-containing protein [Arthrobacter sp. B2a2-09]|uniref:DUF3592 domain-containing protein n=1 Tax=Arthrobacter sp. B2a2-09 TaxID=2952822 RepID=UPI0022CD867B|nr:DUF3592 domain-containing protein [Arthrobacter sp. B2a2-09]MCZ9880647.1 DUF3592 domain-containing protein [Arthrobacter sp. B2a2-09]
MKDRQGNDVPVEPVGEVLPSSREMVGGEESWSVALPDSVHLKASPHLAHQTPAWPGSSLRRRMRLTVAAFAVALTAVVIAAGFGLSAALAPFTAGSVRTGGTVTSQQPYRNKGGDYLCTLGIAYTLGGQQQHTTIDSGKACKAALQPGTQVQLALNSDNPGDVAVLGHGYPRENEWKVIAIIASIMAGFLGLFLLLSALSYRNTKRLFSQETPWQELLATVRGRTQSKSGTTLYLEAQDTTGNDRIFTMDFTDGGPRPKPKPGDILDFALLADGAAHAAVSVKGEHRLHLVSFSVPNDFQLRAIGL